MKKSGKIFRRLTVLLFTGLLSITFSAPREASAASAKYAAYSENNIYKVGKHRYKASVKNQGSRPKAMLYRKRKMEETADASEYLWHNGKGRIWKMAVLFCLPL